MEIAILPKSSLRIKGKTASFVVDPEDSKSYDAVLLLGKKIDQVKQGEEVILNGPGEYEIGGVKITGVRSSDDLIYSIKMDGVDVVLGKLSSLEALHQKMKEHNVVVAFSPETGNASFLTSITSNTILLYGEKASEMAQTFGKENLQTVSKYSTTKDKLPQEVETVILE